MQPLSDRTASFTDSVIRRMTRISLRYDAVNLSQGFPDFNPPTKLLKSLEEISKDPSPRYHQYSITWGAQTMRQALAEKQSRYMGIPVNPDENIVVTCGSTEAMMAAMMTVTNPGDKVVIFSPFYENYGADTILSGAKPVYVPLNPPQFDFDHKVLERAFCENRPKAIVLCNPSNPCGKCLRAKSSSSSRVYARNTMRTVLQTKSMSTSSMPLAGIRIWPAFRGCSSAPLAALFCPRRTRLRDGVWDTPSPRRRLPSALRKCMTF